MVCVVCLLVLNVIDVGSGRIWCGRGRQILTREEN